MHRFDLSAIGAGLVVAAHRSELEQTARTGAMVVTAPPGTGKTTFVAPLIANLVGERGSVLMTQPRRVAVRAAAGRIAQLDGTAVGGAVGFTVRGERRVGADTVLEVLTPGVLLRRLLDDPALDGVAAVILDEVHERSLEGDVLLGLIAEVRELRDDLVVVAMSATLDAIQVQELLGGAPAVEIASVLHPLTISHAPFVGQRLDHRGVTRGYLSHLADVTLAEQARLATDALVFVPGAREVDETVALLRERSASEVLPLHGRVPAKDQDRAVRGRGPGDPPRIVVSTSLAESSLTVPGVHLVIDSGLAREVRRDRARDITGLVTVSASRASAVQRAGRAARLGPGHATRVFSETEFQHMPVAAWPEIMSADLTDTALMLAAWGTPEAQGLTLLTRPPLESLTRAVNTLTALGLVDEAGRPTQLGERIARMPTGAREARALLEGAKVLGSAARAARVVAALSDDLRIATADAEQLLRDLARGSHPGAARWRREAERLERIALRSAGEHDSDRAVRNHERNASSPASDAGTVIALARPEWIARRTGPTSRSYLFAGGSRAVLPEHSPLAEHEWLAVREVQRAEGRQAEGTGAVIRLAAALSDDQALELGHALLTRERSARVDDGRVLVREEKRLGAITLSSTPVSARSEDTGPAFVTHIETAGLGVLDWSEAACSLRGRLALLNRELGDPWPAVDDETLLTRLGDWLTPDLVQLRSGASLHSIDVERALMRLLPWPEASRLEELAPAVLTVPSGSRVRVDYNDGERPCISVKLQELFGLANTPRIVEGRIAILVRMLSPAKRPIAVTDDLSSFWNGPYQQVRKEMRGRYAKHPWPEDPWSALATSKTKRGAGR